MNMKKIFMAALAAMTLLAGCAKENTPVAKQDIKVNFTVAEKAEFGADTKAVKTGWAVGDEILIVFEGGEGWLDFSNNANTFKLVKTAEGWNVDGTNQPELSSLANGKKFFAVHHPGDINIGTLSDGVSYYTAYINSLTDKQGIEYMVASGTYTKGESDIDLGTIALKRPSNMFQISIDNLCNEPNVYNWEMVLYDESGNYISNTNYSQIYLYCYAPAGDMSIVGTNTWLNAHGVDIDGDRAFCFYGNNNTATVKYIKISYGSDSYYYEITPKLITEFYGKPWLLPAVKMNEDGSLKAESKWKTII